MPYSEDATDVLHHLKQHPHPSRQFDAEVSDLLVRDGLAEVYRAGGPFLESSPERVVKIEWLRITDAGRAVYAEARAQRKTQAVVVEHLSSSHQKAEAVRLSARPAQVETAS